MGLLDARVPCRVNANVAVANVIESSLFSMCKYSTIPVVILCSNLSSKLVGMSWLCTGIRARTLLTWTCILIELAVVLFAGNDPNSLTQKSQTHD